MPVAIHCEPVSEPHLPDASFETRWIAASLPLVAPRNDRVRCHREGEAPVAIHCEPLTEQHSPYACLETRWIAASRCSSQ